MTGASASGTLLRMTHTQTTSATGLAHRRRLALGPGLLLAGAAIGVSHLVQATRAGADYGFALFWILVLAIVSKYPALESGPRFAAATGEHLITGYRRTHPWMLGMYVLITLGTMFIIQAAVTMVTAGLAEQLFGLGWSTTPWTAVILAVCILLLLIGRYPALDLSMKLIISLLTLLTFIAVLLAIGTAPWDRIQATPAPSYWHMAGLGFVIAFMGWMPIPLDASVWHSIWTKARSRQTHYPPSVSDSHFDFNVGYGAAAVIGVLFFLLGILVMYGTGEQFAPGAVAFSAQIVELYSRTLGAWSAPLISVAAFVAMFSTTLAVTDIYPRVLAEVVSEWRPDRETTAPQRIHSTRVYLGGLLIVPLVALGIVAFMSGRAFTVLIDFAAGLSFVTAPILAWFNLRVITGPQMPASARPTKGYTWYHWSCLIFLVLLAGAWFYHRFWG